MNQRRSAALRNIGEQFDSRATFNHEEHITESDADLQRAPTNRSDEIRHVSETKNSVSNGSKEISVRQRSGQVERPLTDSIVHHGGQTASSAISSPTRTTSVQRWHADTPKAEPWSGLGGVSAEISAKPAGLQTYKRSKTSSMETRGDDTSRASFDNNGRKKGGT
jgi:hypothetical protein